MSIGVLGSAVALASSSGCSSDEDGTTPTSSASSQGAGGSTAAGGGSGGSGGDGGGPCFDDIICTGEVAHGCNEPSSAGTNCSELGKMCVPGLGCSLCDPKANTCTQDGLSIYCKSDGSGVIELICDSDLGLSCDGNLCVGACAPSVIEDSYIGCEYFPTTALNNINNYDFEVAIANSSQSESAAVKIQGGGLAMALELTVAPGAVERVKLPWVEQVKVCNEQTLGNSFDQINACSKAHNPDFSSRVVVAGAYRLSSKLPVAVYQLSPIEVVNGNFQSGVSEASLLIPQTTFGKRYRVVGYGKGFTPGAIAIVASIDNTTVTVTPTVDVMAGAGNPNGISAGQSGKYTANRGDVIEVINVPVAPENNIGDLTGTLIEADHPVQVISTHGCAWVGTAYSCSHLEDSMLPEGALGKAYLVKGATYPGSVGYWLRVVALEDNTNIELDPASLSPPKLLAKAGDMFEVNVGAQAGLLKADKPVLAAGLIDRESTLAPLVPTERFRNDYLFYVPEFQHSYLKLMAPTGAALTLDGTPVDKAVFKPIGASGYSWLIVEDIPAGPHRAAGDEPFGLMVYGYQAGDALPGGLPSAYEYPGGLDLHQVEPIAGPN